MIYYTGDIHGSALEIVTFCMRFNPTKDDTIVILGDVGANYFGDFRDNKLKDEFSKLEPTIAQIGQKTSMQTISAEVKRISKKL